MESKIKVQMSARWRPWSYIALYLPCFLVYGFTAGWCVRTVLLHGPKVLSRPVGADPYKYFGPEEQVYYLNAFGLYTHYRMAITEDRIPNFIAIGTGVGVGLAILLGTIASLLFRTWAELEPTERIFAPLGVQLFSWAGGTIGVGFMALLFLPFGPLVGDTLLFFSWAIPLFGMFAALVWTVASLFIEYG